MAPTDANGNMLSEADRANFEMQFGGRMHHLNSKGQLRFVDTSAFEGAMKDALEKERRLSQLSTYILGGSTLVANVFGMDVLEKLKPHKGSPLNCNGVIIPEGLAEADATPDVLRLYDPSMKEWLVGSAKFRAVISTYPVVPIGELPAWNMGTEGAGEKTDLSDNTAEQAANAAGTTTKAMEIARQPAQQQAQQDGA